MSKEKIYIFDTTLRDGAQTQGVDFSLDDKEKIAITLDNLGVDYIEGGWPGANPTDTEFLNKNHDFKNAKMTAFGMTKKTEHSAENDPMISSLINSKTSSICIFGKAWDFHVDIALGITKEENLKNISESAKHIVQSSKEFMFDAEHFFDGINLIQNTPYLVLKLLLIKAQDGLYCVTQMEELYLTKFQILLKKLQNIFQVGIWAFMHIMIQKML